MTASFGSEGQRPPAKCQLLLFRCFISTSGGCYLGDVQIVDPGSEDHRALIEQGYKVTGNPAETNSLIQTKSSPLPT